MNRGLGIREEFYELSAKAVKENDIDESFFALPTALPI